MEHRRSHSGGGEQRTSEVSGGFIEIERPSEISQNRKLARDEARLRFVVVMSVMQDKIVSIKTRFTQAVKTWFSEQGGQDLAGMAQLFGVETGQQVVDILSKRLWIGCRVKLKKL
jgi:hypothetical protein